MRKIVLLFVLVIAGRMAVCQTDQSPVETTERDFAQTNVANIVDLNCDPCKEPAVKITIPAASGVTVYSNNILYFKQSLTIATSPLKLIKSIKAELTYFEFTPESDDCFPCNKNSATFGNFDTCTLSAIQGVGAGTHSMAWIFLPPKNPNTFPGIFNITLPPSVKCCTGTIRWCIRYIIEFDDCAVCSKTVCYEKKKTTTTPVPLPNPNNPSGILNRQN